VRAGRRKGRCSLFVLLSSWVIATCVPSDEVLACDIASSLRPLFFDGVPTHINAPLIAWITVSDLLESRIKNAKRGPFAKPSSFRGLASVDDVYRGSIDDKVVRIIAPQSSCDIPFAVGDSGIVGGTTGLGEDGMVELIAVVESFNDRLRRRRLKQ
jgi:hypothetical protein